MDPTHVSAVASVRELQPRPRRLLPEVGGEVRDKIT